MIINCYIYIIYIILILIFDPDNIKSPAKFRSSITITWNVHIRRMRISTVQVENQDPAPPPAAAALIITDAHDPSARFGSLSPSKTLWAHGE